MKKLTLCLVAVLLLCVITTSMAGQIPRSEQAFTPPDFLSDWGKVRLVTWQQEERWVILSDLFSYKPFSPELNYMSRPGFLRAYGYEKTATIMPLKEAQYYLRLAEK